MPTHHPDATYTLEELTSAAGVTVRTVRYYIAEGLLPPPEGSGRAARYSQDHRDRLDVIAMLKDRYLPLREIRETLRGLSPEEVAEMAAEARARLPDHPRADAPLVAHRTEHRPRPHETHRFAASAPPPRDSDALDYIRSIQDAAPPYRHGRTHHDPADQQWRRLPITPEAELMVTEEVWRRRREQIETLLTWARRMINEP